MKKKISTLVLFISFTVFSSASHALTKEEFCEVLAEACKNHGGETCEKFIAQCKPE